MTATNTDYSVEIMEVNGVPIGFLEALDDWRNGNITDFDIEEIEP